VSIGIDLVGIAPVDVFLAGFMQQGRLHLVVQHDVCAVSPRIALTRFQNSQTDL
jgi:hypothetical protein